MGQMVYYGQGSFHILARFKPFAVTEHWIGGDGPMPNSNAIRIFSLNIWNYNEPWGLRRELIVESIRQSKPDIVALQEVQYRSWENPRHQADQIARSFPEYDLVWQPAHYYVDEEGVKSWEGLAILSRLPIIDRHYTLLSRDEKDPQDEFQRIVLGTEIHTPEGAFWVFTTHFPLSAEARERVVREAYDFVVNTARGKPFVVAGDFNAEPDSAVIRFLTGHLALKGERGTWLDAWALLHPDEPGFTSPARNPRERIDYIFVSPSMKVREIALAAMEPNAQGIYPSDHCGLAAELELAV